jgi:hypothetical protein
MHQFLGTQTISFFARQAFFSQGDPVLTKLKHVQGGFNIFRRYRMTHLEKSACPEALKHFWSGHAPRHVAERYVKRETA